MPLKLLPGSHALGSTLLCCSLLLHGCTAAIIATTATVASTMHDRRTTDAVMDDQEIKLRARATLSNNSELSRESRMHVTSYNRRVLIFGQAKSSAVAEKFAHIVSRQPKVKAVYNEVEVAPLASAKELSGDAVLTSKIKTSLLRLGVKGFDPSRVNVSSSRGNVYLIGLVTPQEGPQVVEHVRGISGVKKVIDIFEYYER